MAQSSGLVIGGRFVLALVVVFATFNPARLSYFAERREALSQAEGDITARFDREPTRSELGAHLLDRIRSYFGL